MQYLGAKGNRGRGLSIIKPREEKDEEPESDAEDSEEDVVGEENFEETTPGLSNDEGNGASPQKVQAVTSSFSDSRKHLIRFNKLIRVYRGGFYELRDRIEPLK
jgi:hypothetical protein